MAVAGEMEAPDTMAVVAVTVVAGMTVVRAGTAVAGVTVVRAGTAVAGVMDVKGAMIPDHNEKIAARGNSRRIKSNYRLPGSLNPWIDPRRTLASPLPRCGLRVSSSRTTMESRVPS